jgi:spore germination protein KC
VFQDDRLIGWLNEDESKGYNYITDNVNSTVGPVACPGGSGFVNLEILRSSTQMKGIIQNGKPIIVITLSSVENVGEVECDIDLLKNDTVRTLEKLAAERSEEIMKASLKKIQKTYKSDVFGFGDAIHRADKQYWKQNKDRWDDIFPTVEVKFNVEVELRETGTMNNSIIRAKKMSTS